MLKGIFIDYTGTIIQEIGTDAQEMIRRFCLNSDINDPKTMLKYWWGKVKEYEEVSYGDTFLTEDEIVDKILLRAVDEIHLNDNLGELHELCQRFWTFTPVFDDVAEFFEKCKLPIYVITNNGIQYVEKAMNINGLHPAGIICGDMVRAYKPHKELFEKALEITGFRADEVINIGDSLTSDVKGAATVGIRAILLDRAANQHTEGVTIVHSLTEVLSMI